MFSFLVLWDQVLAAAMVQSVLLKAEATFSDGARFLLGKVEGWDSGMVSTVLPC